MRSAARRPRGSRRGLTLLEMMVTVALLILIMTIVVQIFQSATGAISASRAYQELDQGLRRLDSTIRQDLNGVTARMTPPLDPKSNLGYFEYGENAFADNQGEDTDDYVRFTTKAPDGQPFTGRVWLQNATGPILVTSQYAEIIYFLRNGNLYRRVFLIAPERQSSLGVGGDTPSGGYAAPIFNGLIVSWQGMNDLSAHPSPKGLASTIPVLNTLGDLTNRENRAFSPRFGNDFNADRIPDDLDQNAVPDYYPTLYHLVFGAGLINETPPNTTRTANYNTMPFPYVFPGAYSIPAPDLIQGWIHNLNSSATAPNPATDNQAPLESGDSAAPPTGTQTWFGFPTWRETMDEHWTDPNQMVTSSGSQILGLQPFPPDALPAPGSTNFLPPVGTQTPFNDGAGSNRFDIDLRADGITVEDRARGVWEDDLIMVGVRSFDIKAYDDSFAGYVDLGWGDDSRITGATAFLLGTPSDATAGDLLPFGWTAPNGTFYSNINNNLFNVTYAHEGRIPPLVDDFRLDAQSPNATYRTPQYSPQFPAPPFDSYTSNIGDNAAGVIRLRRVWDSWSTDYTNAPGSGIDPGTKAPTGLPTQPPIYPSYPPPYPMPLRGLQIQVRVVDPRNEKIKTLTIKQDFSDKL